MSKCNDESNDGTVSLGADREGSSRCKTMSLDPIRSRPLRGIGNCLVAPPLVRLRNEVFPE